MTTTAAPHSAQPTDASGQASRAAHAAGLWGLTARGGLYLLLGVLAFGLVIGGAGSGVDARGGLHQLAHESVGSVILVLLTIGFAGFALWHLFTALTSDRQRGEAGHIVADLARAVVFGMLCAVSISFLTTSRGSGNSNRTDQTWTARVLHWPAGQVIVGAVGVAIAVAGLFLLWRVLSGGPQDEHAVLDVAPRETSTLHTLGAVGNVARGAVVVLIGIFVISAAATYDPNKSVGLDGTLKRLLGRSYGSVLVVLVALGFAAFGVYSIARAWVNRGRVTH
jgi:hypothetical protein